MTESTEPIEPATADAGYASVTPIPTVPSLEQLTYRVPIDLGTVLTVGMRVVVPLGRRRVTAIVTELDATPPPDIRCRDIGAVLDGEAVLGADLLQLARWMASYYGAPLGDVLSLAVGRGLTTASKRYVTVIDAELANTELEKRIVAEIAEAATPLDTTSLRRRLDGRAVDAPLAALVARGAVSVEERMARPSVRERRESVIELVHSPDEAMAATLFARAPKRRQIYEYLLGRPGRSASARELGEVFAGASSQVKALEEAGIVSRSEREVYRSVVVAPEADAELEPSARQQAAIDAIVERLGGFAPCLLQGVTSSGKTEVYLRTIREVLDRGGSALVLVPEISLTHQVVARLVARFGPTVAVLHSELSAGERWDEWRRICRKEARIAVGARSAVMAPLHDLQLIVVDEEHDAAYKQEDGVRYHGRDVAIVRAQQAGCPVVLGSATPSIESWQNAREGRYVHLLLPERVTESPLPSFEVVDLRGRDVGATGGISDHLRRLLKSNFEERGQSLLFLNRRGFAANLQCYECGEVIECDSCSVSMTLHRDRSRLRCHHCDASTAVPERCTNCKADALVSQGLGTQRLEDTVREILPEARIERLDRDVAARKGSTASVLTQWRAGSIDVLIGTQMITKGHDAPGVTLVGVVQADLSLSVPDFRASERTFQLLSQVAGRAGRGSRRGRVIVQTYRPDHFAVAAAVAHDYDKFAERELAERGDLGYPPLSRMVLLRFDATVADAAENVATAAANMLLELGRKTGDLVVRGPAPAPIERVKDRYRFQVQMRARDGRLLRHAAIQCRDRLALHAKRDGVRMSIDIDPVDMI